MANRRAGPPQNGAIPAARGAHFAMYAGVQFMVQTTAELVDTPRATPLPRLRAKAAERMPHLEEWLLAAGIAATLWVVCAANYFPYHDATNNLARYVLMDRAWFGTPASFVHVRLIPTPYIALDLVGVVLVHFLGPAAGLRAMACLLVTVVPAGMYALLRATCPERRGWALVGVLCSLSFYLLIGFFNFVAGIGVALFWLAAWWPRRDADELAEPSATSRGSSRCVSGPSRGRDDGARGARDRVPARALAAHCCPVAWRGLVGG